MAALQRDLFALAAHGHIRPVVKANAALEGSGARRVGDGGFVREKHGAGVQQALAILAPDQPAQPGARAWASSGSSLPCVRTNSSWAGA